MESQLIMWADNEPMSNLLMPFAVAIMASFLATGFLNGSTHAGVGLISLLAYVLWSIGMDLTDISHTLRKIADEEEEND